ncbi:MAG: hypothetical protein V4494_07760 [Chlamydiota bacterium]
MHIQIYPIPSCMAEMESSMWHSTADIAQKCPITSRFLAVALAIETFATTMVGSSLMGLVAIGMTISDCVKPDENSHSRWLGFGPFVIILGVLGLTLPIYATVKSLSVFFRFIADPIKTAKNAAYEGDFNAFKHKYGKDSITVIYLPDNSKRYYSYDRSSGIHEIMKS